MATVRDGMTTRLAVIVVLFGVLLFLTKTWLYERRRSMFQILALSLERLGVTIAPSDTPEEIVRRVELTRPELAGEVRSVVDVYVRDQFSRVGLTPEERAAARRALSSLASASR